MRQVELYQVVAEQEVRAVGQSAQSVYCLLE